MDRHRFDADPDPDQDLDPTLITINVPLFKKLRDIIFLGGESHFMSHFEGHFEGAKTFLTPALGTI